jgi:hypothetical protein
MSATTFTTQSDDLPIIDLEQITCDAETEDDAVSLLEGLASNRPDILEAICRHYARIIRLNGSRKIRNAHRKLPRTFGSVRAAATLHAEVASRRINVNTRFDKAVSEVREESNIKREAAETILETWLYQGRPLGDMTREDLLVASAAQRGVADGVFRTSAFYGALAKKVSSGKRVRDVLSVRSVLSIKNRIFL